MPARPVPFESRGGRFGVALADFCDLVIGDENSVAFKPSVRLTRWGEEAHFAFGIDTTRHVAPTQVADHRVEWINTQDNVAMRAYTLPAEGHEREFGGLEYEWLLLAPPASNEISFRIDMRGLVAYQQHKVPDAYDLAHGNVLDPRVAGSWAFYHATRDPLYGRPGEARTYRTGKAFHLFRPEAIDATGARLFGDVMIRPERNLMTLKFDALWLQRAAYPVIIDPTIGYTSIGGSIDNTDYYLLANQWTAGTTGAANPGTVYVYGDNTAATRKCSLGVYADSENPPTNNASLQSGTPSVNKTSSTQWWSTAITWTGITSGTKYWLALSESDGGRNWYDDGGAEGCATPNAGGGDWADPSPSSWNFPDLDRRTSLYVDYAAAGGAAGAFPFTPSRLPRALLVR